MGFGTTASGETHGFVWSKANGLVDIGTLGGDFSWASDINSSGLVAGYSKTAGAAAGEITIYRIIQESLNNVLKHSHADATDVAVRCRDHHVEIEIRDNGQGFEPWASTDAAHPGGVGLKGIAQRVDMLGGTHTIESWPGRGTTVKVQIRRSTQQNPQTYQ